MAMVQCAVTMLKGHFVFLNPSQAQEMDPGGIVCKNKTKSVTDCSDPEQFSSVVTHNFGLCMFEILDELCV